MATFRSIATVPAAGYGRRMGRPKLLLPVAGVPLMDRILQAWTSSKVDHTLVVVRRDDHPLRERCRRFDVQVVVAERPPADMRASLALAVERAAELYSPADSDAWLVAPADLPGLSASLIDHLLLHYRTPGRQTLVPSVGGRRGHPVLLPWKHTSDLRNLSPAAGLNALVRRLDPQPVSWPDARVLDDLDTIADYQRITGERD